MSTHTPTPWHVGPHYKHDIESPSGHVGSLPMTPRGIANAAFIVKAVNSHAHLLEALKACVKWMDDRRELAEYVTEIADGQTAIAAAQGKD